MRRDAIRPAFVTACLSLWMAAGFTCLVMLGSLTAELWAHPVYVTLTRIEYDAASEQISVELLCFTDDLWRAIAGNAAEPPDSLAGHDRDRILAYTLARLNLYADGEDILPEPAEALVQAGRTRTTIRFALLRRMPVSKLSVANRMFHELFEGQQNIIRFRSGEFRADMILTRESPDGVFRLPR